MAKFKPGVAKKGGRSKGVPNKTPEQIRKFVQSFVEKNFQRMQKDFDLLKPVERLSFMNSLLKLVLPPPITPEVLSEHQLTQLLEFIQKKYDEQN